MKVFRLTATCRLILQDGDITQVEAGAIVNAANQRMLGGGGVDGAIHAWAGPELLAACRDIEEVRPGVRCPTGEARITPGFSLKCDHIIHTVGPVYRSPERSAPLLGSAYRSSLALANERGVRTIAFPAVSCGVFHYPEEDAARIALQACRDHAGDLREAHFVLFGQESYNRWLKVAASMFDPVADS